MQTQYTESWINNKNPLKDGNIRNFEKMSSIYVSVVVKGSCILIAKYSEVLCSELIEVTKTILFPTSEFTDWLCPYNRKTAEKTVPKLFSAK